MKKAKQLLAVLLAMAIAMSGMVMNTSVVNAASTSGMRATIYRIPNYAHDIMEHDSFKVSISFEENAQFDETIEALLANSEVVGVPKPGLTTFPYIALASTTDYYIREWKGTITFNRSGTYTVAGQAIDNGFAMRMKPHGAAESEYKTVYEYWGASHWFPQWPILGPVEYPNGTFTAKAGEVFDVEMYYLELDYGEVLEVSMFCSFDEPNEKDAELRTVHDVFYAAEVEAGATNPIVPADDRRVIKLYDDRVYEIDEVTVEDGSSLPRWQIIKERREDAFSFSFTETNYRSLASADSLNALIGVGTGNEEGKGGNNGQCISDNAKFAESIDALLSRAKKGETKVVQSFSDAFPSKCELCDYDGDAFLVLYEGTVALTSTGTYTFGANSVDNCFYMEIDHDNDGEYTPIYEFWAGNVWCVDETDAEGNSVSYNNTDTEHSLAINKGTYNFRAAFLEINGEQQLDLTGKFNVRPFDPDTSSRYLSYYADDIDGAGDDYTYEEVDETAEEKAPKLDVLNEEDQKTLFHVDFSYENAATAATIKNLDLIVENGMLKQIGEGLQANPDTDKSSDALVRSKNGYLRMAENQYLDFEDITNPLNILDGETNVAIEFVVKPEALVENAAFAGLGNYSETDEEQNWAVLGFHADGSVKYGMMTHGIEIGKDDGRSAAGKLSVGTWAKVKYEFTASDVKVYVNDTLVHQLDITSQKAIGELAGGFIFGKTTRFADPGFEGSISEIRVSTFKVLDKTDQQVLFYTETDTIASADIRETTGESVLPNLEEDASGDDVAITKDSSGCYVMEENEYINLDFASIKDKQNATVEFLIKPTSTASAMALVGIGSANGQQISLEMAKDGAVQISTNLAGETTIVNADVKLKAGGLAIVKCVVDNEKVSVFVDDTLATTFTATSGNVLDQFVAEDSAFVFGKGFNGNVATGFIGAVVEVRVTTMPTLGVLEKGEEELFYTNFSDITDLDIRAAMALPNLPGDDELTNEEKSQILDEDGHMIMDAPVYINFTDIARLKDRDNMVIEFVIKPSAIKQHMAFAAMGDASHEEWLVLGMRDGGAVKFGMVSNGQPEVGNNGDADINKEIGVLTTGTWVKVKYEFTPLTVKAYVNDVHVMSWDVSEQSPLSTLLDDDNDGFIFGKCLEWENDPGFEGSISEIRISTFKALEQPDMNVLYYTDFITDFNTVGTLDVREVADGKVPDSSSDTKVTTPAFDDYGRLEMAENQYINFGLNLVDAIDNATIEFVVKPTVIQESTINGLGNATKWVTLGMDADGKVTYSINLNGTIVAGSSEEIQFVKDQWTYVKYEVQENSLKIFVDDVLVATVPVKGNILTAIAEGGVIFGKALNAVSTGFTGVVSELRITNIPTLNTLGEGETELFYTDFSDLSKLNLKETGKADAEGRGTIAPDSDPDATITTDVNGHMVMTAKQYLNLGWALLEGRENVTVEFVIKPAVIGEHYALAGIGEGADNWIVMGMLHEGQLKYGMDTITVQNASDPNANQIGGDKISASNTLKVGTWVKVKYELTPTAVILYVNDKKAQEWNISGQKALYEMTDGSFVFGKEVYWGDPGFSGEIAELRVSTTDELFDISYASMTMANSLDMNFAFEQRHVEDWEGHYAVITKTYADGRADVTQTVPFADWKTAKINNIDHYYVTFKGIAAKEMTDEIYVTIYNADGVAVSNVWTDSVRDQAMRNLAQNGLTDINKTMIVDMLNYGAAAQEYFEYNEKDLATAKLSEEQKKYATESVSYSDTSEHGDNYLANVLLKSNIQLMMAFANIDGATKAEISFTDHYGHDKMITIDSSKIKKDGNYYIITVEEMVVADGRQAINCKVYNGEIVVAEATDSLESYVKRITEKENAKLYEMIMKFSDSAYKYLHT